ncbi:MAG: hypothetical protein KDA24_20635, partial [Deltaproteobacteria bacterium]|nr:hypothetical protein [Deltaproteobacteria bacterium]
PEDAAVWADGAIAAAALGDVESGLARLRRAYALDPDAVDVASFDDEGTFDRFKADPWATAALEALASGQAP